MKDILVCIAHYHAPDRLPYLLRILKTFSEYPLTMDVIVDTQEVGLDIKGENLTVVAHPDLAHPFFLCYAHRAHMKDRIEDYKYLLYCENDIEIPWMAFEHFRTRFMLLWPHGYYPGFIRVEKHAGENWVVDVTERQRLQTVLDIHAALNQPYHACWCLSQEALKANMGPNFVRLSDSREAASSFPMADIGKTALVQVDDGKVIPECWVYHLPNGYSAAPESCFGKIKVVDIFQ